MNIVFTCHAVAFDITKYHPTAMSKMIKSLWLKHYCILLGFDGVIGKLLHRYSTVCQEEGYIENWI